MGVKELVEELNKIVEDLNSALFIDDLVSYIEEITRIAVQLKDEINN